MVESTDSMRPARHFRDDRGASLVLAIIFVAAVGLVLVTVGGLTASGILNSNNLHGSRTTNQDAESALAVAIRNVRASYQPAVYSTTPPVSPVACLPGGITLPSSDPRQSTTNPVIVYCHGTTSTTGLPNRDVTFYACSSPSSGVPSAAACTSAGSSYLDIRAEVAFGDYNSAGKIDCGATSGAGTCGATMQIRSWDVLQGEN